MTFTRSVKDSSAIPTCRATSGALGLILVALTACGDGDHRPPELPSGSPPPTTSTIGEDTLPSGIVVVTNRGQGEWTPDEQERLEERARFAALDAGGTAPLGRITAVTSDAQKRIYVADAYAQQVQVFDSTGIYVRSLGRGGRGPGEFAHTTGLAWRSPSELWILDYRQGRMAVYDTSGRFIRSIRRPSIGVGIPKWAGRFDADRLVERGGSDRGSFLAVMEADGLEEQPRFPDPLQGIPPDPHYLIRSPTTVMFQTVPYAPRHLWVLDGRGGLWVGWSGEYKIVHRELAGDTTLVVLKEDAGQVRVSSEERETAIDNMRWTEGIDLSRIPDVKPYFDELVVAENGELWVVREGPEKTWMMDVFSPDGHLLGTVELPCAPMPDQRPYISAEDIVMVTPGALDIPIVVRLARTRASSR